jgi:hypothetical protein
MAAGYRNGRGAGRGEETAGPTDAAVEGVDERWTSGGRRGRGGGRGDAAVEAVAAAFSG